MTRHSNSVKALASAALALAVMAGAGPASAQIGQYASGVQNAQLGACVVRIGDVTGDSIPDIVVGAPTYTVAGVPVGAVLLLAGNATSGFAGLPVQAIVGPEAGSLFGFAVANVGDVDGDLRADLLIGAPGKDGVWSDQGAAYLYLGVSGGYASAPAWSVTGGSKGAKLGWSVAGGNVDGVSRADLLIGAPYHDGGQHDEGEARVYLGRITGLPSTTPSWAMEGNQDGARFGWAVACIGIVNNDAYGEVAIGAPGYDSSLADCGTVRVYHGTSGAPSTTPATAIDGALAKMQLGSAVVPLRDVNNDLRNDILVCSAWTLFGNDSMGSVALHLGSSSGISAASTWSVSGTQADAEFGYSAAGAGDLNGDGKMDIVVASKLLDKSAAVMDTGGVSAFYQGASGFPTSPTWTISLTTAEAQAGHSIAVMGKVNADARDDIAVGAPWYASSQAREGAVILLPGLP